VGGGHGGEGWERRGGLEEGRRERKGRKEEEEEGQRRAEWGIQSVLFVSIE